MDSIEVAKLADQMKLERFMSQNGLTALALKEGITDTDMALRMLENAMKCVSVDVLCGVMLEGVTREEMEEAEREVVGGDYGAVDDTEVDMIPQGVDFAHYEDFDGDGGGDEDEMTGGGLPRNVED